MAASSTDSALRLAAAAVLGALAGAILTWRLLAIRSLEKPEADEDVSENHQEAAPRSRLADSQSRREVTCADALLWLRKPGAVPPTALIFTSLPDASEVRETQPTLQHWEAWFREAVRAVLLALPPGCAAVFYQTDVRTRGQGQVSKAYLVLDAARQEAGVTLLWHKIVHFGVIDKPSYDSVQFTHLLCFWRPGSCTEEPDLGSTIPDLLVRGQKPWGLKNSARCMGASATAVVLKWALKRLPNVDTVVDPFCGAGTVLAIANEFGLHAVGVDCSPRRVRQATALDGAALLVGRKPQDRRQLIVG